MLMSVDRIEEWSDIYVVLFKVLGRFGDCFGVVCDTDCKYPVGGGGVLVYRK